VSATPELVEQLQAKLATDGVELHWPDVAGY
jgi:hypothetical protein